MNDQHANHRPAPRSGNTEPTRLAADGPVAGQNHLAPGTRLGEFEIIELIGEGGFGIVYLAYDHSLQRNVALKEYMPSSLAARSPDASVSVRAEKFSETFEIGRRSFINEARLLAQFDQPALVKVHRFWEANGTAYMAMPFYEGITLREARKRMAEPPDEEWIARVLGPVMDALELIHAQQCFHRDIAPDNIMLLDGERPVLLDFGAARKVIGDATQALTVILKPGYAPIEQYAEVPGMKQGAWTDIYALAAVIHFLLTGETPPVAVGRIVKDEYRPLAERRRGKYPPGFLQAVDRCLAVRPEERPQTIAAARALLGFGEALLAAPPPREPSRPASAAQPAAAQATNAPAGSRSLVNLAVIGGVVLVAALAVVLLLPADEPVPAAPSAPVAIAPAAVEPVPSPPPASAAPAAPAEVVAPPVLMPAVPVEQAFVQLAAQSEPQLRPVLDGLRALAAGGGQTVALQARAPRSGFLYVMALDARGGELTLLFPNARDRDNAVAATQPLLLPTPGATYLLAEAPREIELLVMFAEHPRRFPGLDWHSKGDFATLPVARLAEVLAAGQGVAALAGRADCEPQGCAAGFGATVQTLSLAAPLASAPVRAAPPAPPVARQAPPVARQAPPPQDPAAQQLKAEQEYMRQLNRDLDKLLE